MRERLCQEALGIQCKHWANTGMLCSGGKDSCYSMLLCRQHGHSVVALANLCPAVGAPDELDSFMFQTVGHQLVAALAACAELPLYRRRIGGASRHTVRRSSHASRTVWLIYRSHNNTCAVLMH